jgi:hypothetical protein
MVQAIGSSYNWHQSGSERYHWKMSRLICTKAIRQKSFCVFRVTLFLVKRTKHRMYSYFSHLNEIDARMSQRSHPAPSAGARGALNQCCDAVGATIRECAPPKKRNRVPLSSPADFPSLRCNKILSIQPRLDFCALNGRRREPCRCYRFAHWLWRTHTSVKVVFRLIDSF